MNQSYSYQYVATSTNKVFENTFKLVALSMLPTALGAWLVASIPTLYYAENPGTAMMLYIGNFVLSLVLMFWALKSRNTGFGVIAMLFFAFSMGLGLGPVINRTLHTFNGPSIILQAALGTGAALGGITLYVKNTKKDFSFLSSWLFGGLIAVLVLSIIGMFFHSSVFQLMLSCVSVVIFLGYLLFDVSRVINGGENNYVVAAISIYLDLINIFINLLNILSSKDD